MTCWHEESTLLRETLQLAQHPKCRDWLSGDGLLEVTGSCVTTTAHSSFLASLIAAAFPALVSGPGCSPSLRQRLEMCVVMGHGVWQNIMWKMECIFLFFLDTFFFLSLLEFYFFQFATEPCIVFLSQQTLWRWWRCDWTFFKVPVSLTHSLTKH